MTTDGTYLLDDPIPTRVDALRPGDLIDLEGDRYADPDHDDPSFPFEYVVVTGILHETPDCIVIHTDYGSCGFPPGHLIPLAGHDHRYDDPTT